MGETAGLTAALETKISKPPNLLFAWNNSYNKY